MTGGGGPRNTTIALVSCIVVFVGLGLLIRNAPGWEAVKQAFFNPEIFFDTLPDIAAHFLRNIAMFCIAEVFVLIFGLGVALVRNMRGPGATPFRWMAVAYVDLARGVPVILLVFLFGFGVPGLQIQGMPTSKFFWGVVALVIAYTAYVAEVFRAGIDSVHPSQTAAARSLGLSRGAAFRYVVLPQAVRHVVPPLLNDFISLQKDTALVSILGVLEAFRVAQVKQAADFNFTPLLGAALLFILVTVPLTRWADWMLARDRHRRAAGGGA